MHKTKLTENLAISVADRDTEPGVSAQLYAITDAFHFVLRKGWDLSAGRATDRRFGYAPIENDTAHAIQIAGGARAIGRFVGETAVMGPSELKYLEQNVFYHVLVGFVEAGQQRLEHERKQGKADPKDLAMLEQALALADAMIQALTPKEVAAGPKEA